MIPPTLTSSEERWYVYLLALRDCSAFKIGFSCNPLQRAFTFSRRYFERFDLHQSLLVPLSTIDDARVLEAAVKNDLAAHRVDCPYWVPVEAGGHTEWFRATYRDDAESRLRAGGGAPLVASEYVRDELLRQVSSFEQWALSQARFIAAAASSPIDAHMGFASARMLQDWLDAYRFCDITLYVDDGDAREFVASAVRHRAGI